MCYNGSHELLLLRSLKTSEIIPASHGAQYGANYKKQKQKPVPLALGLLVAWEGSRRMPIPVLTAVHLREELRAFFQNLHLKQTNKNKKCALWF